MAGPRKYPEIVNNSYPSHGYFDSKIVPLGEEFNKKITKCKCPWVCPPSRGWWKQMIGALYASWFYMQNELLM